MLDSQRSSINKVEKVVTVFSNLTSKKLFLRLFEEEPESWSEILNRYLILKGVLLLARSRVFHK